MPPNVELDALAGPAAAELRGRVLTAPSDPDRRAAVEAWLLGRLHAPRPEFGTVARAAALLGEGQAGAPIAEVCDRLGLSNRYLVTHFRSIVGLRPKALARILRFQRVLADVGGVERVRWADVAARHGYADQPHLIREFRRLSGVTPTEYLNRRTPDGGGLMLHEDLA